MNWTKLNTTFDAEPNAPRPRVFVEGSSVGVRFYLNPFVWDNVEDGDEAILRFRDVYTYRLGPTNDHGFYLGQCRFSDSGITWGDFYELQSSEWRRDFPDDRVIVDASRACELDLKHFLFYFRDETFECVAEGYELERINQGA